MEIVKFTDIPGIKLGHEQNLDAATGCTVVLCEEGASAGVDVRGGAPGTRETDLLDPVNLVDKVHAVLLGGGSAFGLDAASGVMQYLEEKNIGFDVGVTKVPIVTSAILFDLTVGDHRVRPDKAMGYRACQNASTDENHQGTIGAGTGASIGKITGMKYAMKGGLGSYCIKIGELYVGAVVAVNCMGDVIDPQNGRIIAGALNPDLTSFADTEEVMLQAYDSSHNVFVGNTTIGVVATNAILSKAQAKKVAGMAHNGYARTIRPAHTQYDGDTIFALATDRVQVDVNIAGFLAARAMEQAVINAIKSATSLHGLKTYAELNRA